MNDQRLIFKPEGHQYLLDGQPIPSVSAILSPLQDWSKIDPAVLQFAAERGTAVHRACHFFDQNDLDVETLDPQLAPYVKAWERFVSENRPSWDRIEAPLFHSQYRYAGTPDRIGEVDGRYGVWDIKTGTAVYPVTALQLSGYELLARAYYGLDELDVRAAVQLRDDGTYKVTEYPFDKATFLSALNIYNWKAKNGQLG